MISIEQFTANFVGPTDWIKDDWEKAHNLGASCISNLPNIGILSVEKRSAAFTVILEQVQNAISDGKVNFSEGHTTIQIARWSNRKFAKAADAWVHEARHGRIEPALLTRFTVVLAKVG